MKRTFSPPFPKDSPRQIAGFIAEALAMHVKQLHPSHDGRIWPKVDSANETKCPLCDDVIATITVDALDSVTVDIPGFEVMSVN